MVLLWIDCIIIVCIVVAGLIVKNLHIWPSKQKQQTNQKYIHPRIESLHFPSRHNGNVCGGLGGCFVNTFDLGREGGDSHIYSQS